MSQQGVGAMYGVVTIVLLSTKTKFVELVWTRLGTYDFLGLRNVVRGATVISLYLDPDG